uniref:Uncharacterized protein n=1 Tax=Cacopsylla melanoneura TaxID=428564 RepID=A0A8D8M5K7_9HEMI
MHRVGTVRDFRLIGKVHDPFPVATEIDSGLKRPPRFALGEFQHAGVPGHTLFAFDRVGRARIVLVLVGNVWIFEYVAIPAFYSEDSVEASPLATKSGEHFRYVK